MTSPELLHPAEWPRTEWRKAYELAQFACEKTFIDGLDIDAYLGEFDEFYEAHLDPMKRVGNRDNANQEYHHPRVAVLYEGDELQAWGSADHNVSGRESLRDLRRLSIVKNHFHPREIYTKAGSQGEGRGKAIVRTLGKSAIPGQPWTVYLHPGLYRPEVPSLRESLTRRGFLAKKPRPKELFGEGSEEVLQVPMERKVMINGSRVFK